jgi:hypothetical protein
VLLFLCIPSCSTCFSLECGIVNMPSPCLFPASMCDCHYEFMFLTWMCDCYYEFMFPASMCDCHYEFMFPASMCDCHYEFMFLTWMHYCHDAFISSMVWGFIPIRWGIGVQIDKTTWSRPNPNSSPTPNPM